MKCQQCGEPATAHITEIQQGQPHALHFCGAHPKAYLARDEIPVACDLLGERTVVDLQVTQSQIENEATVSAELPDGKTVRLKLSRSMITDPACIMLVTVPRSKDDPSGPPCALRLRVAPGQ